MTPRLVAGVDGCPAGWVVASELEPEGHLAIHVVRTAADLLTMPVALLAIDIPLGLLPGYTPGGREADRGARRLLGAPRSSSVFSAPSRAAFELADCSDPRRPNLGLTRQAWAIMPKVREVDALVRAGHQWVPDQAWKARPALVEVHPELSFYELNGRRPLRHSKRRVAGRRERGALLTSFGDIELLLHSRPPGVNPDDLLDALVALWTARRIRSGTAISIPEPPPTDEYGLRMEIVR